MLAGYEKVLCGADNQHTAWLKKETLEKPLADMFLGGVNLHCAPAQPLGSEQASAKGCKVPPGFPQGPLCGGAVRHDLNLGGAGGQSCCMNQTFQGS